MKDKVSIQRIIVFVSIALLGAKFLAYSLTFSVSILTDAMESIVNVVAGIISLYSLKLSIQPRDKDHPYGHGRVEFLSASIEGLMIIIAGGLIAYEAIWRWVNPIEIKQLDIGIWIVAASGLVNYLCGTYSVRRGKKLNSVALIASGKHLQSDTYSSIGIVVGLLIMYFTNLAWIDSVLALIFGFIIVFTGLGILRKTAKDLMDKADPEILQSFSEVVEKNRQEDWVDVHNVKMVKYGSEYFIDCDLTLPYFYSVEQAHRVGEGLKAAIDEHSMQKNRMSLHFDPCEANMCPGCGFNRCDHRKSPLKEIRVFNVQHIVESDE